MNKVKLIDQRVASAFYGQFTSLKPCQDALIEPLLLGRNVVLSSGTGSGKTEAAMAPLISRYWPVIVETDNITLLYIAPTKALVNDLEKRLYQPLSNLGLRVGVRHGDRDDLIKKQRPHVLITTPESLEVLLFRKEVALRSVRAVIIDEVHLLYNTQRGLQLSILLNRLREILENNLQWAALSATLGCLSEVRDFLFGHKEAAEFMQFSNHRTIDANIRHILNKESLLNLIRHLMAGRQTKILIFANARRECERLAGILYEDDRIRPYIFAHYSSLSPEVRLETEQKFAFSSMAVCIATSTLELGIDIGDIDIVLLWDVPSNVESFLQRIGRGNRRANKTNVVCCIPDTTSSIVSDTLRFAALINAASDGRLPLRSPYELYGAVAQQCLSYIGSEGGHFTSVAKLCELMNHKDYLRRSVVETILDELTEKGYLQRHGFKNKYGADENLHTLVDYRLIYGNYPASSQYIEIRHGSKVLGEVPAVSLLRLNSGILVRFAGKSWRVQKVTREAITIEPSKGRGNVIDFVYPGGKRGFDAFTTDLMWRLLHADNFPAKILSLHLREKVNEVRKRIRRICSVRQIPYFITIEGIRYLTFAGYLINKAIGLYTQHTEFTADELSLVVESPIDWQSVPTNPNCFEHILNTLYEPASEQTVYQSLLPANLQVCEFLQDWFNDQTVPSVLSRLANSVPVEVQPDVIAPFIGSEAV
ncbi:MAG: DEAD/DEAH box helicase [Bacillota bacterium]